MKRVLLLLALVSSSLFAQQPSPVMPSFFGMHILHAVNGTTPWPTVQLNTVRLWDSGADWKTLNPAQGTYNWTPLDQWLNLAQQHNVDLVYTFGRVPDWANGSQGQSHPPSNLQLWDAYVTAVATHAAGRIKYWELWNEPNNPQFWYDATDVATLVTMSQHAYQIIKSIQPTAVILTPPPTYMSNSTTWTWMNSYLQAGGGKYADVIAFHGYVGNTPEDFTSLIVNITKVVAANGQSAKPLWDTESSWSTGDSCGNFCDPNQQAGFLVRAYMLRASYGLQRAYWYAWEDTWGTLWDPTKGALPAATAYAEAYKWLIGATISQPCAADSNGTWSCTITRPGYQGLVVWNNNSTAYTAPALYKQYRGIAGNKAALPASGSVTIGYEPILLETGDPITGPPAPVLAVTPATGAAPLVVSADASASHDPEGTITSAVIDFGDGNTSPTITAAHMYTTPGTYTVTVSVTDNLGQTVKSAGTVVTVAPPAAAPITVSVPAAAVAAPRVVHMVR